MERYELIAPCHFGLEAVLKKEVVDLGYEVTEVENGRVTFIGDAEAICHAAALAIKSLLGLVCDPIAGLVEVPCIKRNASGAMVSTIITARKADNNLLFMFILLF